MYTTIRSVTVALATAIALLAVACGDSPPTGLGDTKTEGVAEQTGAPVLSSHSDRRTLVVDDDGADCPHAGYVTVQAAVDDAAPNTTILVCAGVYNERVLITGEAKNGLRLLAHGAPGTVVLEGAGLPPPGPPGTPSGDHGFHLLDVSGVLIDGFTLRAYFENIRLTGGGGHTVRKNHTSGAGHDGIFALNSSDNVIEHNVATDNPGPFACGINLVGPLSHDNVIRHNVVSNNNWGINVQFGPTGTLVFGNSAVDNRSHGILNRGSSGTTIANNRVSGNGTGGDASVLFPGGPRAGIGVQGIPMAPEFAEISNDVTVARNAVFQQADGIVDIFWDEQGDGNAFVNNHCSVSEPDGLCAQGRGRSN